MATSEDPSSPKAKRRKLPPNVANSSAPVGQTANASQDNPSYAKSYLRVSKANVYMIIALCVEDFVDDPPEPCKKVGAVLVLNNDVVCAADCSRDGVHAVARLLMKHYDKAKGSKMFMSRKPCPMCAKLLVQSKVERVLFLPFEPEYYRSPKLLGPDADEKTSEEINKINDEINESNNTQMKQVDNLFTASAIAQTRFVLQVEKPVLEDAEQKTPSKNTKEQIHEETRRLVKKYGFERNPNWMECIKDELPWPAFDNEIKAEVLEYFDNAMKWMARANVLQGRGLNYEFEACSEKSKNSDAFNPLNNSTHSMQARHFMAIARFLAERTDDPKAGVGGVIVSPEMEIISLGWNGFPLKALYGEFPRASKDDKSIVDKKYPYVIHAEQNALLFRNNKNIKGTILFVTKSPCNECAPLIAMQGIETVVVDDDVLSRDDAAQKSGLGYKKFPDMIKSGKFVCFQTREPQADPGPSKASRPLALFDDEKQS